MGIKTAFCIECRREVLLDDADELTCPVCSSPLIESSAIAGSSPASEMFLG